MNNILIKAFLMGWYDPIDKRTMYRARQDAAKNGNPVTQRVQTMKHEYWGLM